MGSIIRECCWEKSTHSSVAVMATKKSLPSSQSVTAGDKLQADSSACDWYSLLGLNGSGKLFHTSLTIYLSYIALTS